MKPHFWWITLASLAIVAAFAVASNSIYQASRTGEKSRSALCKVLLFSRKASLSQPLEPAMKARIITFYDHVIVLVDGCHIPKEAQ